MSSVLVLSQVGDQTWGAVLLEGHVVELHVENSQRPGVAGNVYKGRVTRVLPGMQSAFVDVGLERSAFLHVADLPSARPGEFPFEQDDPEVDASLAMGVPVVPRPERSRAPQAPIQDLLREGQEILVQVAKEPIAAKGARLTAQIGLPGRALVFMPHLDRVFVSRRIEDADERERLRTLTEGLGGATDGGWIVRTAAERTSEAALARDQAYLRRVWAAIDARERGAGAPTLLHHELGLAERLLRDVLTEEFQEVVVDSERLLGTAREFLDLYMPGQAPRVRLAESATLFDDMGIHTEIEKAAHSRLWLKGGGSIVVNPTEALVAIDVNTGKYTGRKDLEETALRTNLEAVDEIARLLRLRDLGGIIVIDFIDMVEPDNREAVIQALAQALRRDRSRTKLLAMSDLGLVQLTRKRTRRSLDRILQSPCPACQGSGRIRSVSGLYYRIVRDLARGALLAGSDGPRLRLHPASAAQLEEEGLTLRVPGRVDGYGPSVRVTADASIGEDQYELIW